jgi:exonuclease III
MSKDLLTVPPDVQHRIVTRPLNEGMRIDCVLVSPGLLDRVVSCEIMDDATPPEV